MYVCMSKHLVLTYGFAQPGKVVMYVWVAVHHERHDRWFVVGYCYDKRDNADVGKAGRSPTVKQFEAALIEAGLDHVKHELYFVQKIRNKLHVICPFSVDLRTTLDKGFEDVIVSLDHWFVLPLLLDHVLSEAQIIGQFSNGFLVPPIVIPLDYDLGPVFVLLFAIAIVRNLQEILHFHALQHDRTRLRHIHLFREYQDYLLVLTQVLDHLRPIMIYVDCISVQGLDRVAKVFLAADDHRC